MASREVNRITINEFPDYECIMLYCPNKIVESEFRTGSIWFKYYADYRYRSFSKKFTAVQRNGLGLVNAFGKVSADGQDKLLIHPKCRIPRKLITDATVINDKSVDVPTKLVIPKNYEGYIAGYYDYAYRVVFMVNEDIKTVFAIHRPYSAMEHNLQGTYEQWLHALINSHNLHTDFGSSIYGFTMPFGTTPYMLIADLEDIDALILSNGFPSHLLISEENVLTGSEVPTADMLYSAYNMLNSPDYQIVLTAMNMLAQSRFMPAKELIGWILDLNRKKAKTCRSTSTSIAWLYDNCILDRGATPYFKNEYEKQLARDFISKLTQNEIVWNTDGTPFYAGTKWISNHFISKLVGAAKSV